MANRLWERLRGARWIELFAALALAALIALLLLKGGSSGGEVEKTELESRVERILSRMEGVGEVSAMITEDEAGGVRGALIVAGELDEDPDDPVHAVPQHEDHARQEGEHERMEAG